MKTVDYCVCCGSRDIKVQPSKMFPFVVQRMTGDESYTEMIDCGYITCLNCGFKGSQIRFSIEEERRYYQDYMTGDYLEHRCIVEGDEFRQTAEIFERKDYIEKRKKSIVNVLTDVLDLNNIMSVLDFGGNTGKMIPDELSHANRFVSDVQIRELDNGIIGVTNPEESGLVDLVICGHTLEHVSDPVSLIEVMKKYLKPGGWLYLEVPADEEYIPIHEHINHFNEQSLTNLLTSLGFTKEKFVGLSHTGLVGNAQAIVGKLI